MTLETREGAAGRLMRARVGRLVAEIAVILVPAAAYLWFAAAIREPTRQVEFSPRDFPLLIAVLMMIVAVRIVAGAVWDFAQFVRQHSRDDAPVAASPDGAGEGTPAHGSAEDSAAFRIGAVVVMAAIWLYAIAFDNLGYLVTSILFVGALTGYFSRREKRLRNFVVAAVVVVGLQYLFEGFFGVQLPDGVLEGIL